MPETRPIIRHLHNGYQQPYKAAMATAIENKLV
jgi:hypothetical protein